MEQEFNTQQRGSDRNVTPKPLDEQLTTVQGSQDIAKSQSVLEKATGPKVDYTDRLTAMGFSSEQVDAFRNILSSYYFSSGEPNFILISNNTPNPELKVKVADSPFHCITAMSEKAVELSNEGNETKHSKPTFFQKVSKLFGLSSEEKENKIVVFTFFDNVVIVSPGDDFGKVSQVVQKLVDDACKDLPEFFKDYIDREEFKNYGEEYSERNCATTERNINIAQDASWVVKLLKTREKVEDWKNFNSIWKNKVVWGLILEEDNDLNEVADCACDYLKTMDKYNKLPQCLREEIDKGGSKLYGFRLDVETAVDATLAVDNMKTREEVEQWIETKDDAKREELTPVYLGKYSNNFLFLKDCVLKYAEDRRLVKDDN